MKLCGICTLRCGIHVRRTIQKPSILCQDRGIGDEISYVKAATQEIQTTQASDDIVDRHRRVARETF